MTRIEKSIEIKASPEKVWEMLALDRQLAWMEGWKSVDYTSKVHTPKDKYGVGASAHITEHVKYDLEVTESLENERMTIRSKRPTMTRTYILKPVEEGTKLTYVFDYEMPGGILGKGLGKLGGQRMAGKDMEKSLEKLKSVLEK